jgi:hypothetical protein
LIKPASVFLILAAYLALAAGCETGSAPPVQPDANQPSVQQSEPAQAAYTFVPSGLDGAGFQNVVAIKPGNPNYVVSGADVAGIHVSVTTDQTRQRGAYCLQVPGLIYGRT